MRDSLWGKEHPTPASNVVPDKAQLPIHVCSPEICGNCEQIENQVNYCLRLNDAVNAGQRCRLITDVLSPGRDIFFRALD